ncbi:hypothetical protein [Treponema zioleckii]|uniref:hypothetical protein n=1 Tax=Treponema zioleckii TaxID=331680 RepID=UPI00168B2525|nr:hypothetical protein [Treponema zioleckii]
MARSIHWTMRIFRNKSSREIAEMCDSENLDYAVEELIKKRRIKRSVHEQRALEKMENSYSAPDKEDIKR